MGGGPRALIAKRRPAANAWLTKRMDYRHLLAVGAALVWSLGSVGQAGAAEEGKGATCNRSAFKAVIDVGHTPQVPGAKSARGVGEYEFNLRLATLIKDKLVERGFSNTVLLVTEGRKYQSLNQRVARANKLAPDLFLSIHHDAVPDSFLQKWEFGGKQRGYSDRFKGHSIFVSSNNGHFKTSLSFAKLLGHEMKAQGLQYTPHYTEKIMGRWKRELIDPETGVYHHDKLIVLKDTHMPAVLLEAGSIINRDEELQMASPERQSLISAAVVDAMDAFCGARPPHDPELSARGKPSSAHKKLPSAASVAPARTPPQ
jgi:N-acetylmuramoyl-L-alanine amidase